MASLDLLSWTWDPVSCTGLGEARQNVWSRSYRRLYEKRVKEAGGRERVGDEMMQGTEDDDGNGKSLVKLAFRIRVVDLAREVVIEWVRGSDQVLWESLCGVVHRHFKKS
jgi:23S rRNA (adenine1618-N6)-methyltransferase